MSPDERELIVVSIQGRGLGLAADFAKKGRKVLYLDLTQQMGVWPPEDQEGPFGFFRSERYSQSSLERLNQEDPFLTVEGGWTFWPEEGPLEMRGANALYRLKKMAWKEEWIQSLSNEKPFVEPLRDPVGPFLWPLRSAHILGSTVDPEDFGLQKSPRKLPLGLDFAVRLSSRTGAEKSHEWLRSLGAEVNTSSEILDLALEGTLWTGFEVKGKFSGLARAPSFVWALSSLETEFYNPKLWEKIFNKESLDPIWSWVRFRGRVEQHPWVKQLPLHFVMVRDVDSPWARENSVLVQRTAVPEQMDYWIKIPTLQRFNKEYLDRLGEKLRLFWLEKVPLSELQWLSYPQEYYYTYEELGPSPFPVFEGTKKKKFKRLHRAKNAWTISPEQLDQYSWENLFEVQTQVGQQLETYLVERQKKLDRGAKHD